MSINQLHYSSNNSSILDNCLSITRKGRTKRPLNADVPLIYTGHCFTSEQFMGCRSCDELKRIQNITRTEKVPLP